jgi:hypothetical protein
MGCYLSCSFAFGCIVQASCSWRLPWLNGYGVKLSSVHVFCGARVWNRGHIIFKMNSAYSRVIVWLPWFVSEKKKTKKRITSDLYETTHNKPNTLWYRIKNNWWIWFYYWFSAQLMIRADIFLTRGYRNPCFNMMNWRITCHLDHDEKSI